MGQGWAIMILATRPWLIREPKRRLFMHCTGRHFRSERNRHSFPEAWLREPAHLHALAGRHLAEKRISRKGRAASFQATRFR